MFKNLHLAKRKEHSVDLTEKAKKMDNMYARVGTIILLTCTYIPPYDRFSIVKKGR